MNRNKKLSKKEFDAIIKENLLNSGVSEESFGYKTDKDRIYHEYYVESEFNKFVCEMKSGYPEHYKKYYGDENASENKGGMGGELIPKRGRWGMMPPKMASVASSSRFCYLALRDGTNALFPDWEIAKNDVEFEKECRIFLDGPTAPQLDAYIENPSCSCYIEAKCHEIFDSHKIEFKNKYWDIFRKDKSFGCVLENVIRHDETFELSGNVFNLSDAHLRFDVKQFICHLLGIANQAKGKQAKLVYLFFKPKSNDEKVNARIDEVFDELRDEIDSIFTSAVIVEFCLDNQIVLEAIVQECNVIRKLDICNSWKLFPRV